MTIGERFERIEHVTVGLAEERRKDREEYRQLRRDTQRQINALTRKIADTNDTITRMSNELTELGRRTDERFAAVHNELAELSRRTDERIQALVGAMGEFLRNQQK